MLAIDLNFMSRPKPEARRQKKFCVLKLPCRTCLAIIYADDRSEASGIAARWFGSFPFDYEMMSYNPMLLKK